MAIERLTFSNDLKAKDLYYCDEFFSLKGEKIIPSLPTYSSNTPFLKEGLSAWTSASGYTII